MAVGMITELEQAEAIVASGQADMMVLARGMLYDPRWPWHAGAKLSAQVEVPRQYWRSQPRERKDCLATSCLGSIRRSRVAPRLQRHVGERELLLRD